MTAKKDLKSSGNDNSDLTAIHFMDKLMQHSRSKITDNARFFKDQNDSTKILGIRMSELFALAKEFKPMPLHEIEKLLNNDYYEARLGAVSIMDFQARDKKTPETTRKQLYELYIKKHHCINNWDLVDRSAPYVVGGYLYDKSRNPLYQLAKSKNIWERRTAIVSTYYFIRQDDLNDTFKIAALLVNDKEELINMAVGSWIREAGKRDKPRLLAFLDEHAATMPRVTLRYAVEKLDKKQKEKYMSIKK